MSPAGDQVQYEIIESIKKVVPSVEILAISMQPVVTWPRGVLLKRGHISFGIVFVGFLNIPVIKHLIFSMGILYHLIKTSPELCIQYNSYFFENISLFVYRIINPRVKISIIIQDVHINKYSSLDAFMKGGLKYIFEFFSMRTAKLADCVVAISDAILEDFQFDKYSSFVFPGGVTSFAQPMLKVVLKCNDRQKYAVFAGALEPHNGVNKIIDAWLYQEIPYVLHIFGRGSLSSYAESASLRSSYIIYHGFQNDSIVRDFQKFAHWNICLRYSIGLDERYFFPSKFFNSACAPGHLIVNRFYGLPNALLDHLLIVDLDLSNLSYLISKSSDDERINDKVNMRRDIVVKAFSWSACLNDILNRCIYDRKTH